MSSGLTIRCQQESLIEKELRELSIAMKNAMDKTIAFSII